MIARILTVIVALALLARFWLRHRRGDVSRRRMLFWSLPWIGLLIVMLSPELADGIARSLGVETATGIDLVAYVAVGVAFYALFRLSMKLDRLERELTALARHIALRDARDE